MATADEVLARAGADIGGGKESPPGSNCTTYSRWYSGGCYAWCAAWVSYWFGKVGAAHLVAASTAKGFIYTPSGADWFRRQGRWGSTPRRGALVFFRFSGGRIHHVGIVEGVNRDGSITTIEANTSPGDAGSQRDGGGVYRRVRRSGIVGYGYPAYSPAEPSRPATRRRKTMFLIRRPDLVGPPCYVTDGFRVRWLHNVGELALYQRALRDDTVWDISKEDFDLLEAVGWVPT